jgi:Icc-related predicted phosphoesterase
VKIVALTDMHGDTQGLKQIALDLQSADVILLCGDITHFGSGDDAARIIEELERYNEQIFAVAGNCDLSGVDTYLYERHINVHGKMITINGINIIGVGGSLPCPGNTPNEYNEHQFMTILNNAKEKGNSKKPLLVVAHQPPSNTINDMVSMDVHVGSASIRDFIEAEQPLICFTGHIHEGVGIDSIAATKIVNPGPFKRGGYTVAEVDTNVEELEIRNWKRVGDG